MTRHFTLIALVLISSFLYAGGNKDYEPSDVATTIPVPYDYSKNKKYEGIDIQTHYLTMRDSVKIAVDVYLPKGLEKGTKIPTILHQTRYWRSPDLRWPFSMFSNGLIGPAGKIIKKMVANGYAIVNVDARGSGASFGNRIHPWTEDETKDGAEIVDWIIKQEWSNGNVGAIGASYSGTTAEFLLVNQHPNVKAVILLYSLFDVYDDIAYPGGIFHEFFVENWGKFNNQLDKNHLPRGGFLARLLVKGVRRVNTSKKVRTFHAALRDHEENLQVNKTSKGVDYRDQAPKNGIIKTMDVFSPHTYVDEINASGAAVYCYSGWMDGDYQHAAIKRFLNLTNPENKLLIGPWEHGGQYNCSPANPGKAGFDHVSEFLKFFDYHLKGIETGIYDEPRVHYFTMGEEQWKSADSWPPESKSYTLYMDDHHTLSSNRTTTNPGFDTYKVDTTAGTGDATRWKALIGMLKTPYTYPNRTEQDKKLLCYDSNPLPQDIEVSGHPVVTLYVSSTAPDGNFHVYLEEVDSSGHVNYVTEGLLRGIHRKICNKHCPYQDVVPNRTYKEKDAMPLVPGEVAELKFDLLPTSYLFKKGHSVRIAIAGADKDHFKVMYPSEPILKIYRNDEFSSNIVLPVADESASSSGIFKSK